ncbi:MAG TPA: hypothetical protein PK404_04920 [Fervidobacterium sp.]|nr:hypothetical protein [Fervidobacterium sp.]HOK88157.1 hypothetical protein [Fervidobacterium sp.]HOM74559.1 hypothetical protein [Fervidobacterium sp.]HRD20641.1 hypothetical protein [Fervidobacterium sp.]
MNEYGKAFVYVALVVLLGLAGFFIPSVPTKILIVFVSLILTGYFLKFYTSKMAGFILLAIFLFLIPAAMFQSFTNFLHSSVSSSFPLNAQIDVMNSLRTNKYEADTSIGSAQNVVIKVKGGVEVRFVPGSELNYYHGLNAKLSGNTVTISGGKNNSSYVIEIGIEPLKMLDVASIAVEISGGAKIDELSVSGTGVSLNSSLDADYVTLSGTGISVDGSINARNVDVNGTGVSFIADGEIGDLKIAGSGISMDTALSNCSNIDINGTGIDGRLEYLGGSDLHIEVHGTAGKLTVTNRSANDITINSSGVKVFREDVGSNG